MNIIQAVILGLIEGLTEFLPVSSTFHLIFTSNWLGIPQTEFVKLFQVFIQAGAILAVFLMYWKTLLTDRQLLLKVIVSFIPTAVIGFVLYKVIKGVFFENSWLMVTVFILMGFVFFFIEYLVKQKKLLLEKKIGVLDYKQAVIIGLAQSLAVIPGVSRAGAVIVAMMGLGVRREDAARYSFLLSIPTIFAASLLDLIQMREVVMQSGQYMGLLVVGFAVAFTTAYFVVKWLISFLQKNSLVVFGWYRILVGIIVLLFNL